MITYSEWVRSSPSPSRLGLLLYVLCTFSFLSPGGNKETVQPDNSDKENYRASLRFSLFLQKKYQSIPQFKQISKYEIQ